VITALGHAMRALYRPRRRTELLVEGVEQDVLGVEYETFDELVRYCAASPARSVALCAAIFADGAADEIYPLADDLAWRCTDQHKRDIVEDRESADVPAGPRIAGASAASTSPQPISTRRRG